MSFSVSPRGEAKRPPEFLEILGDYNSPNAAPWAAAPLHVAAAAAFDSGKALAQDAAVLLLLEMLIF